MADLTRPNFGEAWASEGEKLSPGEAKLKLGWVQEMMTYQYENYLQARQDEAILYLLQKGVPEYSATQEYTANKSVVAYQGNLYMATSTVTGVLPTVTASWKRISPTVGANGAVSISSGGTGATTVAEARTNLGLGTASTVNLPTTNGVVVRSTSNTLISRLLTGTSGNISVTNPDGVAGNINIDVGTNVAQLDKDSSWTSRGGITLPKGSSSERGVEVPGKIRYNTELQKFEGYNGTDWNVLGATSEVEITTLSGDGVTTSFTLTTPAFSETSTDVYIGGVWQNKGTYNVSGSTITFSEAPTPGTDNIQVVSRRVVDLGVANASQVGIKDTSNYYTATTVEGALREVGEDFAKLTSYTGTISSDAEWSDVPAHSNPAFNVQAQALANRTEFIVEELTQPSGNEPVGGFDTYAKVRNYTGTATRIKVKDSTGMHWWVRRGSAADNGGTVLKDAMNRSWEREFSGAVNVKWFGAVGDYDYVANTGTDDTNAIQAAIDSLASTAWAGSRADTEKNYAYGKELFIPNGMYMTTRGLLVPAGITIRFEGGPETNSYSNQKGRRTSIIPKFSNPLDWVIQSATYDGDTGELIPYHRVISGVEFDSGGDLARRFNHTRSIRIINASIYAVSRVYGGIKINCGLGSSLEDFSITGCDYGVALSSTFTARAYGTTLHHKCGMYLGHECNNTRIDGYFNRQNRTQSPLDAEPLTNSSGLTSGKVVGVYIAAGQGVSCGEVTAELNDIGVYVHWTSAHLKTLYTEGSKDCGIYLNTAKVHIGQWMGLNDVNLARVAYGSSLTVDIANKHHVLLESYTPMPYLGSNNRITINDGFDYFDPNVNYGSKDKGVIYVDGENGNDLFHGLTSDKAVKTVSAAITRIKNKRLSQTNDPHEYCICLMGSSTYELGSQTLTNIRLRITNYNGNLPVITNNTGNWVLRNSSLSTDGVRIESTTSETVYRTFHTYGKCEFYFSNTQINLRDYKALCECPSGELVMSFFSCAITSVGTYARLAFSNIADQLLTITLTNTSRDANTLASTGGGYSWATAANVRKNF